MKNYLNQVVNTDDVDLVSVIDDLPLWSAPFGLKLLDAIEIKRNINVLDVGCGLGFPAIEISQRLGASCRIYGIDPWEEALERAGQKLQVYNIENVHLVNGYAEELPFEDVFFDLIVSNNGINNVRDLNAVIRECFRVSKYGAQFIATLNLSDTMKEFYSVFKNVLEEFGLMDEIGKTNQHIYQKRRPVNEIKTLLEESGYSVKNILYDSFNIRFADGTAMLNHYFIKYWFLDSWKNILKTTDLEKVFDKVETDLNSYSEKNGFLLPFLLQQLIAENK